jgi:hypothetical protein
MPLSIEVGADHVLEIVSPTLTIDASDAQIAVVASATELVIEVEEIGFVMQFGITPRVVQQHLVVV